MESLVCLGVFIVQININNVLFVRILICCALLACSSLTNFLVDDVSTIDSEMVSLHSVQVYQQKDS